VLANYRTTLVAIAPLLLMYFAATSLGRSRCGSAVCGERADRACAVVLGVLSLVFAERFNDVTVA
jgi:hypothetical protein